MMKCYFRQSPRVKNKIYSILFIIGLLVFYTCGALGGTNYNKKFFFHKKDAYSLNEGHKKDAYRLNEGHKEIGCASCHPKNGRRGKKMNCGSCHSGRHVIPQGVSCITCHTLEDFSQIKNYKHRLNDFFWIGTHKTLSCRECHKEGRFRGTPRQCVYCHLERHQDSLHGTALGGDCSQCHTPFGWQPVRYHHLTFTLSAAHRNLNCLDCHQGYEFNKVTSYCYSCHNKEFHQGGFNHAAAILPYDCLLCHSMYSFNTPISYRDHPAGLIQLGNHRNADCLDCHQQLIFQGTRNDCLNCHQQDYNTADNPPHLSSGFPYDCELCHKPVDVSWNQGNYNHTWLLQGIHQTLDCLECHQNGIFAGKSSACFSCHQTDYEESQNPDHQEVGFSTACDECHQASNTSWAQGSFNHSFPLTGDHSGLDCVECHLESANYTVFTCTDCHAHQQQGMNSLHRNRGVSGYSYNSQSCYFCHPQGRR